MEARPQNEVSDTRCGTEPALGEPQWTITASRVEGPQPVASWRTCDTAWVGAKSNRRACMCQSGEVLTKRRDADVVGVVENVSAGPCRARRRVRSAWCRRRRSRPPVSIEADAVGVAVAGRRPHSSVRQRGVGVDVERSEVAPVGLGDGQRRVVGRHGHAVGEYDAVGDPADLAGTFIVKLPMSLMTRRPARTTVLTRPVRVRWTRVWQCSTVPSR